MENTDRDGRKFPLTMNKYHHGNAIYPNVLGIRLVLIQCDLAENSYGLFISIFFFFNQKFLSNCRILLLLSQ